MPTWAFLSSEGALVLCYDARTDRQSVVALSESACVQHRDGIPSRPHPSATLHNWLRLKDNICRNWPVSPSVKKTGAGFCTNGSYVIRPSN